jgi:hypothetical protein
MLPSHITNLHQLDGHNPMTAEAARNSRGTPAQASGFHGVAGPNAWSPISDPVCPQQAVAAPEANQGGAGQRQATRSMMRSAASIRRRRPSSTAARCQGSIAWPSSTDGVEPDAVQEGRQQRNDGTAPGRDARSLPTPRRAQQARCHQRQSGRLVRPSAGRGQPAPPFQRPIHSSRA